MRAPEVRYTKIGESSIAYQVAGNGSLDIVLVPGFVSNLDLLWEQPAYVRLVKRLSTFGRLILFDRLGSGLSERTRPDRAASAIEIRAVMEATGCGRAALIGVSDGVAASIEFAVDQPERVRKLVLFGGYAHFLSSVMDARKLRAFTHSLTSSWGSGVTLAAFAPSRIDDRRLGDWWARFERLSATPAMAAAAARFNATVDVRARLSQVHAPTLALHRMRDGYADIAGSREIVRGIKAARLIELPGSDHLIWLGDVDHIADEIEEFLTGVRPVADFNRTLAAVLAGHVEAADRVLDRGLLDERLERFHDAAIQLVEKHGGRAEWIGANRIVVRYESIARATAGALELRDAAEALGLSIAQGVHLGEIDTALSPLTGQVVDIAAAIAAAARAHDILLSQIASELISGSGLQFTQRAAVAVDGMKDPLPVVALGSERHLEPVGRRAKIADLSTISTREREVLSLVADGLSNTHIAVRLGLSEHTVKRHVANILLKLDLPSRTAAAALVGR